MNNNNIQSAIHFVKYISLDRDGSHDFTHSLRVMHLATALAQHEGIQDIELIQLAALLHDVDDYKYSDKKTTHASDFLKSINCDVKKTQKIFQIIEGISFRSGLSGKKIEMFPELGVVRDADRLDAMGAIGIARAFCYGGSRGNPLYDPSVVIKTNVTKEEYNTKSQPTINHFYEKLLLLKDTIVTESGKKEAEKRHQFMLDFLTQFYKEWDIRLNENFN